MNLLQNAFKYNDKERIAVEIIFFSDNEAYSFEVKDNGPGIAAENKEKIFELFQRLDNHPREVDGMGIGLAIVKRLTEKLGGKIAVESEPGEGTSFILSIPK
jgi:signal transduction histidine kinase